MIYIKPTFFEFDLSSSGSSHCLRVGKFQLAWGYYPSVSEGTLPWAYFVKPFKDSASYNLLHQVWSYGVRVSSEVAKEANACRVQTFVPSTDARSATNGFYVAFGRWI